MADQGDERKGRPTGSVNTILLAVGGTSVVSAVLYAAGWLILEQRARLLGLPVVPADPTDIFAAAIRYPAASLMSPIAAFLAPGHAHLPALGAALCIAWMLWRAIASRTARCLNLGARTLVGLSLGLVAYVLLESVCDDLVEVRGLLLDRSSLPQTITRRLDLESAAGQSVNLEVLLRMAPSAAGQNGADAVSYVLPVHRLLATCLWLLVATVLWCGECFLCLADWQRRGGLWPSICSLSRVVAVVVVLWGVKDYLCLLGVVSKPFDYPACYVSAAEGREAAWHEYVFLGSSGDHHLFLDCETADLLSLSELPERIVWRPPAHVLRRAVEAADTMAAAERTHGRRPGER